MSVNTCPVMPVELTADEVINRSRRRAIELVGSVEEPDEEAHEVYLMLSRLLRVLFDADVSTRAQSHFYVDRDANGRPCLMLYPMPIEVLHDFITTLMLNVRKIHPPANSYRNAGDSGVPRHDQ